MTVSFYSLLPWVLPPLVGAAIGYITNAIAIRMLFRPLTEKRIFGVRIPFTPGIIPKQRDNLAGSIADMVSQQLFTEDAVRRQITSERFRNGIDENIASFSNRLLDRSIGDYLVEKAGTGRPRKLIRELTKGIVESEGFKRITRRFIQMGVDYLFALKIADIVRHFDKSGDILYGITGFLTSEKTKTQILLWTDRYFLKIIEGNETLSTYLPQSTERLIGSVFEYFYPSLYEAVITWLNREDIRRELEVRGKDLLKDIIDRLRPIQKFFVSAAGYDQTLDRKMPEIIGDLVNRVKEAGTDPAFRDKITEVITDSIASFREKTISDFSDESLRQLSYAVHVIVKMVIERLSSESVKRKISSLMLTNLTKNDEQTIGEVLDLHFKVSADKTVEYLTDRLTGWMSKSGERIGGYVLDNVRSLLKNHEEKRVRDFFGINEEVKTKIDRYISNRVISLLETRVPHIVRGFDVHSLVVDKINSLNIENVEKLLLMVIEKHLKWINIFGAILGAFIGALQVILNRLV